MRTINDLDLTLQARAFVSLFRRHGTTWRESFARWAENKGFNDTDRRVIEAEAARIHVNGEYDDYLAGVRGAVAAAHRAMLEVHRIDRRDPQRVESMVRGLVDEFRAAVEIASERREALGEDDPAALEGVEYTRRRIVEYVVGLVAHKG